MTVPSVRISETNDNLDKKTLAVSILVFYEASNSDRMGPASVSASKITNNRKHVEFKVII